MDEDQAIQEYPDDELSPPEDEPDWRDDVDSAGEDDEKEATVSVKIETEI